MQFELRIRNGRYLSDSTTVEADEQGNVTLSKDQLQWLIDQSRQYGRSGFDARLDLRLPRFIAIGSLLGDETTIEFAIGSSRDHVIAEALAGVAQGFTNVQIQLNGECVWQPDSAQPTA